ncbi:MAG TPA: sulfatase-like hydrolase/transferase [Anaeromyxobacter sp.]|nr:sulfatase-like hydrolase/transferase [Anaeromyxobacter sp.]
MSLLTSPEDGRGRPSPDGGAGLRFPALLWALLHVPVILALYAGPIAAALRATPEGYRALLWPTFVPQALLLGLLGFVLGLPFAPWPRLYRFAAPAAAGLVTAALSVDARVFGATGFHLNGFFFRVLFQANALRETGVPPAAVALFVAEVLGLVVLDALAGAWFLRRFAARRRTWIIALALVLLSAAERVYGASLTYFGGAAIFAASTTLPLQIPVRMGDFARVVFGKTNVPDPFAGQGASKRLPAGVDPAEIRFTRTPDVLFVVAESLPANHLDERTMPNLWRRSAAGARFLRHYAGASSTNYTLFSLVYGQQAQKLEATVGSGRQPVLFPALARNGYAVKVLAASCVDWMDLKDTVFAGVRPEDLQTWCEGTEPPDRDKAMLAAARATLASAPPDRPLFLFLFFFGTHFNYFYDPQQDRVFVPDWDGANGIKATSAPGPLIDARARNAAHALDRELEGFLREVEARRGKSPLVVFTGDHGEEFRQKGHIGHGSAVTSEQIHVPAVWFGPGVPVGEPPVVTSHYDILPTLLALLGDTHPPALYSDGVSMFQVPPDRFVVSTVGWEPQYAAIGKDLKVTMYAGLGRGQLTDPDDQPIADAPLRMARSAGQILRALRGEAEPTPAAADGGAAPVQAARP